MDYLTIFPSWYCDPLKDVEQWKFWPLKKVTSINFWPVGNFDKLERLTSWKLALWVKEIVLMVGVVVGVIFLVLEVVIVLLAIIVLKGINSNTSSSRSLIRCSLNYLVSIVPCKILTPWSFLNPKIVNPSTNVFPWKFWRLKILNRLNFWLPENINELKMLTFWKSNLS